MGSKEPLVRGHSSVGLHADEPHRHSVTRGASTQRLLKRIADAIQVSPGMFYSPPDAVDAAISSKAESTTSGAGETESAELLAAFNRIGDPEERLQVLLFVQKAADKACPSSRSPAP